MSTFINISTDVDFNILFQPKANIFVLFIKHTCNIFLFLPNSLFIPVLLAFYLPDCHLMAIRWLTELQSCLFSLRLEEEGTDSVTKPPF